METSREKIQQAFLWLLPNGIEVLFYVFITGITMILSGVNRLKDLLFVSGDFNPIRIAVAAIDSVLTKIVGERVAASLSLAIFWAMIGVIVNILWWLGSNVTTEISNDLAFSKYVHPKGVDPQSQLREFLKKAALRTTVAIVGLLYFNYFISTGLPHINQNFSNVFSNWSNNKDFKTLALTILTELLLLHIFVVLSRIVLLRKRIFSR